MDLSIGSAYLSTDRLAVREYVIPDLHGCQATLERLLEEVRPHKNDRLYFLGDYVNKGPRSYDVIEYLISLKDRGYKTTFLLGNHDLLLKRHIKTNLREHKEKIHHTLQKHISKKTKQKKVLKFLDELIPYVELEDCYLVHAGFDFNLKNPFADVHSQTTIRNFRYSNVVAKSKTIVHGHHPHPLSEIISKIESRSKVLPLDNGCVYRNREEMGNLLCYELRTKELRYINNIE